MSFSASPIGNQPLYLQPAQTIQSIIRARLIAALTLGLDTSTGSVESDILTATAMELAQAAILPQDYSNRVFTATSYAPWLDYKAQERGLTRLGAVAATGTVTFTAATGQAPTIPANTRVGTPASPSVVFLTQAAVTLSSGGTASVAVTAQVAGSAGNVQAGTVTVLIDSIAGVQSVTNAAAMSGGTDQESDNALRARILLKASQPPTSGNQYQYQQAVLAVAGVGGAQVVRAWNGPGNVAIALIDSSGNPASAALITATENALINPWRFSYNAGALNLGGFGGSIDTTLSGNSGNSVAFTYSASGAGSLSQLALASLLPQPGIWRLILRCAVSSPIGAGPLLQFGVQYTSSGTWVPTVPPTANNAGLAQTTITASQFSAPNTWQTFECDFYWDGASAIQLLIQRLQSDTITKIWVDTALYQSSFTRDDQSSASFVPLGDRATVLAATAVPISVSVHIDLTPGSTASTVQTAVQTAIQSYISSIPFTSGVIVSYAAIAAAISGTTGVQDISPSSLLINGAAQNVGLPSLSIPTFGSVTFT